jgi:hypothetical protein
MQASSSRVVFTDAEVVEFMRWARVETFMQGMARDWPTILAHIYSDFLEEPVMKGLLVGLDGSSHHTCTAMTDLVAQYRANRLGLSPSGMAQLIVDRQRELASKAKDEV